MKKIITICCFLGILLFCTTSSAYYIQNNTNGYKDSTILHTKKMVLTINYLINPSSVFTAQAHNEQNTNEDTNYYSDVHNVNIDDVHHTITITSKKIKPPIIDGKATYRWSSGVLSTFQKGGFFLSESQHIPHGYIEMKASLPLGKKYYSGSWPAFWLMPATPHFGWPYGVEIDIMETLGSEYPNTIYNTIHYYDSSITTNRNHHASIGVKTNGYINLNRFHRYGMEWIVSMPHKEVTLVYYFDRHRIGTMHFTATSNPILYHNFMDSYTHKGWYIILDTYIGTNWGNDWPNATTKPLFYNRTIELSTYQIKD